VDPYLAEIAQRLGELRARADIDEALDRIEFLYDALDSEQQDLAAQLIERLRARLDGAP
jgi:hypothetical protein